MTTPIRGSSGPRYTSQTQSASTQQAETKQTSTRQGYSTASGFDATVKSEADELVKQLKDVSIGYDTENLKPNQVHAPALGETRLLQFKEEAQEKIKELLQRTPPPSPEEARQELEAIRNEFDSKVMVENFMMNNIFTTMMGQYEKALQEMARNFGGG